MAKTIDLRVLELLCSRICHDLISPVTAINNGMELMEDDSGDMFDEIRDLLMNSALEGSGKLQFFRLAYGVGGDPDGMIGVGTAADLCAGLARHEKANVAWTTDREAMLPRLAMKAALNMVLLGFEALPRGGEISVTTGGGRIEITAEGTGARIEDASAAALAGDVVVEDLTPRTIQAFYTRELVDAAGGTVEVVRTGDNGISFRATYAV